jgi:hypothetical protein
MYVRLPSSDLVVVIGDVSYRVYQASGTVSLTTINIIMTAKIRREAALLRCRKKRGETVGQ